LKINLAINLTIQLWVMTRNEKQLQGFDKIYKIIENEHTKNGLFGQSEDEGDVCFRMCFTDKINISIRDSGGVTLRQHN